jgi:hypothetical protein
MRTEVKIPAINKTDLTKILKYFDLENAMEKGDIHCASCSQQVNFKNFAKWRACAVLQFI